MTRSTRQDPPPPKAEPEVLAARIRAELRGAGIHVPPGPEALAPPPPARNRFARNFGLHMLMLAGPCLLVILYALFAGHG